MIGLNKKNWLQIDQQAGSIHMMTINHWLHCYNEILDLVLTLTENNTEDNHLISQDIIEKIEKMNIIIFSYYQSTTTDKEKSYLVNKLSAIISNLLFHSFVLGHLDLFHLINNLNIVLNKEDISKDLTFILMILEKQIKAGYFEEAYRFLETIHPKEGVLYLCLFKEPEVAVTIIEWLQETDVNFNCKPDHVNSILTLAIKEKCDHRIISALESCGAVTSSELSNQSLMRNHLVKINSLQDQLGEGLENQTRRISEFKNAVNYGQVAEIVHLINQGAKIYKEIGLDVILRGNIDLLQHLMITYKIPLPVDIPLRIEEDMFRFCVLNHMMLRNYYLSHPYVLSFPIAIKHCLKIGKPIYEPIPDLNKRLENNTARFLTEKNLGFHLPHLVAATTDNIESLKILILHGLDIHLTDYHGNTALHYAAAAGNVNAIRLLILHTSDLNITNKFKQTALHVATKAFCSSMASNKSINECIKLLIRCGSNPYLLNNQHTKIIDMLGESILDQVNDDFFSPKTVEVNDEAVDKNTKTYQVPSLLSLSAFRLFTSSLYLNQPSALSPEELENAKEAVLDV